MNKHTVRLILQQLDVLQRNINELRRRLQDEPASDTEFIRQQVAAKYQVPIESLNSRCRRADLAWARQVAMWLCRDLLGYSFQGIGDRFDKDCGTAKWACRRVANVLETERDRPTAQTVLELREAIRPHLTLPVEVKR